MSNLPKASEVLTIEIGLNVNNTKFFYLTGYDCSSFETKEQAQSLIDLWDRAPELEAENQKINDALRDILKLPETIGHAYQMKEIAKKALTQKH